MCWGGEWSSVRGGWAVLLPSWLQTAMAETCAWADRHFPPWSVGEGREAAQGLVSVQPMSLYWEIPRDINVNNNNIPTPIKLEGFDNERSNFLARNTERECCFQTQEKGRNLQGSPASTDSICLDFYTNTRKQAWYFKKCRCPIKSACEGIWYLRLRSSHLG